MKIAKLVDCRNCGGSGYTETTHPLYGTLTCPEPTLTTVCPVCGGDGLQVVQDAPPVIVTLIDTEGHELNYMLPVEPWPTTPQHLCETCAIVGDLGSLAARDAHRAHLLSHVHISRIDQLGRRVAA